MSLGSVMVSRVFGAPEVFWEVSGVFVVLCGFGVSRTFWRVLGVLGALVSVGVPGGFGWSLRVLGDSGGVGEPLRYFGGVWGILRGLGGIEGVSEVFWGVSGNVGVSKSFGGLWGVLRGLWGCPPPLTPPPAVCVLYTQRPGSHQWREVSDPIGGEQPISMLGCAQLGNWHVRVHSDSQLGCWGTSWPTNHQHVGAMTDQYVCVCQPDGQSACQWQPTSM